MAKWFEDRKIGTLILITVVGFIIGSYLSLLIGNMVPGDTNVVKIIFTSNLLPISFGYPNPVAVNLGAMKLQFGFETDVSLMSIIGVIIALWAYRWYK